MGEELLEIAEERKNGHRLGSLTSAGSQIIRRNVSTSSALGRRPEVDLEASTAGGTGGFVSCQSRSAGRAEAHLRRRGPSFRTLLWPRDQGYEDGGCCGGDGRDAKQTQEI